MVGLNCQTLQVSTYADESNFFIVRLGYIFADVRRLLRYKAALNGLHYWTTLEDVALGVLFQLASLRLSA